MVLFTMFHNPVIVYTVYTLYLYLYTLYVCVFVHAKAINGSNVFYGMIAIYFEKKTYIHMFTVIRTDEENDPS